MQVHLDRVAVECRQILGRDNILVKHHIYPLTIYPFGHLALVRYDKMYLADKWHILGYSAKEIAQCAPITKAFLDYGFIGILLVVALPHRVQPVYVCNDYIHLSNIQFWTQIPYVTTNIYV